MELKIVKKEPQDRLLQVRISKSLELKIEKTAKRHKTTVAHIVKSALEQLL